MNPNKMYCQANKAIIEELDGRVAALEEGGGGGTEYTAGDGIDITNDVISVDGDTIYDKTEVDGLLDEKQDVLTADEGIKIEDNVVSLDNGWKEVTSTEFLRENMDFSKYEYAAKVDGDYVFMILAEQSTQSGTLISCISQSKPFRNYFGMFTTAGLKFIRDYITYSGGGSENVATADLKLWGFDGIAIDSTNISTYLDSTKCLKPCIVVWDRLVGSDKISYEGILTPGEGYVVLDKRKNSTATFPIVQLDSARLEVSNIYNAIVNATAYVGYAQKTGITIGSTGSSSPFTPTNYYRRLKI